MESAGYPPYPKQPVKGVFKSYMKLVHKLPPHLLEIQFTITLPSMPMSSERCLPFRISNHNFIRISHFPHASYKISLIFFDFM